jgi:hypothetical protein
MNPYQPPQPSDQAQSQGDLVSLIAVWFTGLILAVMFPLTAIYMCVRLRYKTAEQISAAEGVIVEVFSILQFPVAWMLLVVWLVRLLLRS